jgi:CheY-like chemotaxis protein
VSLKLIMVVEDDLDLRDTLADLLSLEGYAVVTAVDGRTALDWLRNGGPEPHVIILDLMMPGMSGWEFRRQQLADPALAHIPVIVTTASSNIHTHPIDVPIVLAKPVAVEILVASIERAAVRSTTAVPSASSSAA